MVVCRGAGGKPLGLAVRVLVPRINVEQFGGGLERAGARRKLEGLQREQVARRQGDGVFRQNASAGRAITVAAPALIWWLSEVVCGRTRAR